MKNYKFNSLVSRILEAIDHHPVYTFWNIHIASACEGMQFSEIRFKNCDDFVFSVNVCKNEVSVIVYTDKDCTHFYFVGSCDLNLEHNYDTFMMWLGFTICRAYKFALSLE